MVVRVTVLMAVYNPPLWMLKQAVDSILQQTFVDFEFLIVDDGSTLAEVASYLEERTLQDPRIRLLKEPHRGLTPSLNRGLREARGEYIARQDADDWSAPERLQTQIRFLDQHASVVVCGTNAWTHQESGRRLWRTKLPLRDLRQAFPAGNPLVHGSVVFRKLAALELSGYCETFRCSQDYHLFWKMAERGEAVNLAEPLYHYRYTDCSVSANKANQQQLAHHAIRLLAETRRSGLEITPEEALMQVCNERGRNLSGTVLKQADHLMLAGKYGKAARAYLEVLARQPKCLLGWGKLARLGVFWAAPALREACFR